MNLTRIKFDTHCLNVKEFDLWVKVRYSLNGLCLVRYFFQYLRYVSKVSHIQGRLLCIKQEWWFGLQSCSLFWHTTLRGLDFCLRSNSKGIWLYCHVSFWLWNKLNSFLVFTIERKLFKQVSFCRWMQGKLCGHTHREIFSKSY